MKKIKLIILFIIIFLAGFLIANGVKYYLDMWKADRNVQAWQKGIDDIFTNDTYGGATPEETFDMYLAALKKGDLELASRYYFFTKQQKELESLKNLQTKGEMDVYIQKLENAKGGWTKKVDDFYDWKSKAALEYKTTVATTEYMEITNPKTGAVEKVLIPPGEYKELIQFEKANDTWKLYLL